MDSTGSALRSAVGPDDETPAATSCAPSPSVSVPSTLLEQTLLLLRPAVFRTDSLLLSGIYQTVADCNGLTNTERTVLLPNMPSEFRVQDSPLRRLLYLSAPELRLLASIFQDGLIAARNLGVIGSNSVDDSIGSESSKRSLERDNIPLTPKRAKMTVVGPEPVISPSQLPGLAIPPIMPPPLTPRMRLLLSLGISDALPPATAVTRMPRWGTLGIASLARQHNTCAITGRSSDTTAHLVPHAVSAMQSIAVTVLATPQRVSRHSSHLPHIRGCWWF